MLLLIAAGKKRMLRPVLGQGIIVVEGSPVLHTKTARTTLISCHFFAIDKDEWNSATLDASIDGREAKKAADRNGVG